jgi:3-deoxy-D-manno-octulosonate 8-phosphate phosphatase (KDO 8-P phosphatase)
VLTDGGLYFSEGGETLKRFSTLDGHGLKLLARPASPRWSSPAAIPPLRRRLQALGITHVHYGTEDKRPAAEQTLQALGLDWSRRRHRRRLARPARAAPLRLRLRAGQRPCRGPGLCPCVTRLRGGEGAGREFCDLLLVASGRYAGLLQDAAS